MTEKRFTTKNIINSSYCVWDNDGKEYGNDDVVDLLNELSEQADAVRTELQLCEEENNELQKENEQLKQLIKKTLETTPIEHNLAVELKNSVRELYD